MQRTLTTQDISWFLDLHQRGRLDLDPPYQRRSVWSPTDKRFFIDTILNNYPAPPVFLHKTVDSEGSSTYHVVDGKQRLQTIVEFTQGRVRIPDTFGDVTLRKRRWKELERPTKDRFWNYELSVEMLPDVTDAAINSVFERINRNSRKLTAQEMRHARYDGWFITYVEQEAARQEWKTLGVVTTARVKRMADVQFVSELCAVILKGCIVGFDQDALDNLYAEYEDPSETTGSAEDELPDEVERVKAVISEILRREPELGKYLKTYGHFYSLWAFLHLNRDGSVEIETIATNYRRFLASVTAVSGAADTAKVETAKETGGSSWKAVLEYANYFRGASTDLTPRSKRHQALVDSLQGPGGTPHEGC